MLNNNQNNLYGYHLKVLDYNGAILDHVDVYDDLGITLGTTDDNGYIEFTYPTSIVTATTKETRSGYYLNVDVAGELNGYARSTVMAKKPYCNTLVNGSGPLKLGDIIAVCNHYWEVCHIEDGKYYLGMDIIIPRFELIPWFISNKSSKDIGLSSIKFANSCITERVSEYEAWLRKSFDSFITDNLCDVTVNGVTSKVFVPSKEQMDGGFEHLKYDRNRICYDYDGEVSSYWTSTLNDKYTAWVVKDDGALTTTRLDELIGLRLFICLSM